MSLPLCYHREVDIAPEQAADFIEGSQIGWIYHAHQHCAIASSSTTALHDVDVDVVKFEINKENAELLGQRFGNLFFADKSIV